MALVASYLVEKVKQSLLEHKEVEPSCLDVMMLCELAFTFGG
jgi:hypothetical protein